MYNDRGMCYGCAMIGVVGSAAYAAIALCGAVVAWLLFRSPVATAVLACIAAGLLLISMYIWLDAVKTMRKDSKSRQAQEAKENEKAGKQYLLL